jgi:hypothetical protein
MISFKERGLVEGVAVAQDFGVGVGVIIGAETAEEFEEFMIRIVRRVLNI